jgi:hypothetical protein
MVGQKDWPPAKGGGAHVWFGQSGRCTYDTRPLGGRVRGGSGRVSGQLGSGGCLHHLRIVAPVRGLLPISISRILSFLVHPLTALGPSLTPM